MAENENNNAMLEALDSIKTVNVGDVVKGRVLQIDDDRQAIVGIEDSGVEGVVPANQLSTKPVDNINDVVKVGDELDLVVISKIGSDKENGSYLLSHRRLEAMKVWNEIQKKFDDGETITATVTQAVKGGLVVDAGVRGFVPASMITDHYVEDLNQFKGEELEFKIIEIEPSENRLILSHKEIVQAQHEEAAKKIFSELVAGDVVEGKVARMTNFGAFIDLGGVDGLVHVSEISYDHVDKPADVLEVGQEVKVKVLNVDPERERISLSIKQTLPGPWDDIEEKAAVGTVLTGTVKRLTSFGAFVEVFPGVEGLVHISQISHKHIATPADVLEAGQEVKVKVLNVDPERQRLGLSIKALEEAPAGSDNNNNNNGGSRRPRRRNNNYIADAPEEESGFNLGDLLGDQLKNFDK
ncbi:30S ribosomal protein S1 [Limosilactobacillus fermentum]|uniref:30S ribosomal protein S1 n=1 Tax=Limosilactobacillus fermentum TaxID=1613 RepID=A0A2K2TID1_LIMFE|nr:30S ribosomal protein S1 [Limosilactobacillus fermentum]ADJ41188.1 30S ribosomal protein S1 [Limosilactobacillus fermentum CECT 5716]MBC9021447.1 30S ribosomal protein S1 [Limosilactobacillus fermentum CECT 5716]MCB4714863.1 30S ribosomal protein S1 [Limosilactobacillus fermentum]MCH5397582.1 30S ribosomal protein S1 [Limosilactobacillus fermentum]MDQ7201908.1 30S ribosomal protein S1 [Limosilactobacillus fermentum]